MIAFGFDFNSLFDLIQRPKEYLLSHPEALDEHLVKIIAGRCKRYIANEAKECSLASKEFLILLNLGSVKIENQNYFVSLSNDLENIYKDQRLTAYLNDLNLELDKTGSELKIYKFIKPDLVKPVDLGLITQRHFKNKKIAIKVMATLFQDVFANGVPAHLTYLYEKFGQRRELELLLLVNNKIGNLHLRDGRSVIRIFGTDMPSVKIYHYLVPAYMAVKLRYLGKSKAISFILPFMFNYLYEISNGEQALRAYFFEPKVIASQETRNDIKLGELGAALGADSKSLLSVAQTDALLSSSTIAYISKLIEEVQNN